MTNPEQHPYRKPPKMKTICRITVFSNNREPVIIDCNKGKIIEGILYILRDDGNWKVSFKNWDYTVAEIIDVPDNEEV